MTDKTSKSVGFLELRELWFADFLIYRIAGNIGGNNIWRIARKSAIGGFNFGGPLPPRVKEPS